MKKTPPTTKEIDAAKIDVLWVVGYYEKLRSEQISKDGSLKYPSLGVNSTPAFLARWDQLIASGYVPTVGGVVSVLGPLGMPDDLEIKLTVTALLFAIAAGSST